MNPTLPLRISTTPLSLRIEWGGGTASEFASIWLRDNRPSDRDPVNGQRLIDVADLPLEPKIRSATLEGDAVRVAWEGESAETRFALEFLRAHSAQRTGAATTPVREWLLGAELDARTAFAWMRYAELHGGPGARLRWLTHLLADGIAFVREVPCTESAILEAVAHIGRVCATNYGEVFDVRSVPRPENLAYSDLGLGLHTDNPYREPVPGFQALHVLAASPDGGESLFADGFALASHLKATAPADFARLTQTAVPFQYRSRDAELHAERPLIQLSCGGEVTAVHYNNRSIAPLPLALSETQPFYAAYRRFALLLRDPRYQLRLHLAGGDLVVFDNQRILHGRTAFSSARHPRHLRGCYLTRDSVLSTTALQRRASTAGAAA